MKFKKILYIFLWLLTLTALVVLLIYSSKQQQALHCRQYHIQIHIFGQDTLLYQSDIHSIISKCSDSIVGKRYSKINMERIEKELLKDKYIKAASVYGNLEGLITIDVVQHTPSLRVITQENESFYLDLQGNKIDCERPAHVLVANGYFDNDTTLQELLQLYRIIHQDAFLNAQIGEIYRAENGIYQLIPVVGDHEIILGRSDNFEEGLSKLKLFYEKGMNDAGWKDYKKIDVRFRDQVVCSTNKEVGTKAANEVNIISKTTPLPDSVEVIKQSSGTIINN
ncbi:MAG: hypothetical protein PHR53_07565 [Bacteroidales bacterium]|nr:hypothetical protein [Bacteroidales bacterium]